jgi:hypothetical protein
MLNIRFETPQAVGGSASHVPMLGLPACGLHHDIIPVGHPMHGTTGAGARQAPRIAHTGQPPP